MVEMKIRKLQREEMIQRKQEFHPPDFNLVRL
jgi:hypothetical protein